MGRFQPGHKRLGGMKKGQVTKKSRLFKEILESKGFNTLDRLISLLDDDEHDLQDPKDRLTKKDKAHIYCELMQYEFPKRKAVEIEDLTPDDKIKKIQIGWADEDSGPRDHAPSSDTAAKKDQ